MELGLFTMPSHPPERSLYDGHQWDLQVLRWADELGYKEAWIGEHHTAPWEPHPAPDLLVAQALLQTKNIRLGPGGFLLPYHHPAELANRVAMLDHMAQGRLNFGVAASGLPSDWAMFNVDGNAGQQPRDDARVARHHPQALDRGGAVRLRGQVLARRRSPTPMLREPRGRTSGRSRSRTRRSASPVSATSSDTLEDGRRARLHPDEPQPEPELRRRATGTRSRRARARTGRTPSRADWRMVREVFVADTDEEAWRCRSGGMMGRMMREYFLPLLDAFGVHRST